MLSQKSRMKKYVTTLPDGTVLQASTREEMRDLVNKELGKLEPVEEPEAKTE